MHILSLFRPTQFTSRISHIDHRWIDAAIFLAALTLYTLTLSPGLLPADAGEFQLVAARLGVAHPPGYPLYTMLGWIFTWLTPHNPMRGVNLFSAVTAALTVMLVGRAARRMSGSLWSGIAASLALAVAASFWSTATQASIRPLTAFFTALAIERLTAYRERQDTRTLAGFALAFALGLTHHPSLAFPGIFFAIYLVLVDPSLIRQPRRWLLPIGAFLLGFLPWLYLPIRASMGAPLAPDSLTTWSGFWDHVVARGFAGDLFSFHTPTELADRARVWINILVLQWHPVILLIALVAAIRLLIRDWRALILLGGVFLLHSLITMTYRAPQTVEYLIQAYVAFTIALGAGIAHTPAITTDRNRALSALVIAVVVITTGIQAIRLWPSFLWLSRDDSTRATAHSLLENAPENAVILASWHWAMPMQALQQIDGLRPDVEPIYVYPDGAERLADTWVRRIGEQLDTRPVIVTSFYPAEFAAAGYFYEPIEGGWQVRSSPPTDLPDGMTPVEIPFTSGVTLVGIDTARLDSAHVGGIFDLRLAWRVDSPLEQDITGFVHFLNSAGTVISSSDRPLPTSRAQAGDILIDRYTVGMPPSGLPSPLDDYRLEAGMYAVNPDGTLNSFTTSEGQTRAQITPVVIALPEWAAPSDENAFPFGGEMFLTDVKVTPEGALKPGQAVIIDLTFFSARPLLNDYVVKVDLIGEDFVWRVGSDHIPGEGGIPTLKWLWGWRVHDRHRFIVPAEAAITTAHAELVIYDHFTNQILPILDPILAQQGIAVRLYEWP